MTKYIVTEHLDNDTSMDYTFCSHDEAWDFYHWSIEVNPACTYDQPKEDGTWTN